MFIFFYFVLTLDRCSLLKPVRDPALTRCVPPAPPLKRKSARIIPDIFRHLHWLSDQISFSNSVRVGRKSWAALIYTVCCLFFSVSFIPQLLSWFSDQLRVLSRSPLGLYVFTRGYYPLNPKYLSLREYIYI